jgi:hypothetical protein
LSCFLAFISFNMSSYWSISLSSSSVGIGDTVAKFLTINYFVIFKRYFIYGWNFR